MHFLTIQQLPPPRIINNNKAFEAFVSTFCKTLKNRAFTLAEVLITLTIIGIVAAMTIPTLMHKYQNHLWATKAAKALSFLNNQTELAIGSAGCSSIDCMIKINNTTQTTAGKNSTLDEFMTAIFPKSSKKTGWEPITLLDGTISTTNQAGITGAEVHIAYNLNNGYALQCHDLTMQLYSGSPYYRCTDNYACGSCVIFTEYPAKKYLFGRNVFKVSLMSDGSWKPVTTYNSQNSSYCKPGIHSSYYESCLSKMQQNGWKMDY